MITLLIALLPSMLAIDTPTAATGYRLPPPEVVAILDAAPTPDVDISPDGRWMLLTERPAMPTIADVMRPWVGLAGSRIDVARNAPQQLSFAKSIVVRTLRGGEERRIALPSGARMGEVSWAPTSDRFAFTLVRDDGVDLYTCASDATKPVRIAENVNGVLGSSFTWLANGKALIVKLVDKARAARPSDTALPSGPVMQESSGKSTPLRTYQDLLGDEHDAALFEYCGRSQLVRIDAAGGTATKLGAVALYSGVDPSPDGAHLLVTRLHQPFSYVLPDNLFPQATEVWSAAGKLERTIVDAPLGDNIPMEGVRTGPRSVQWQASAPATLFWTEAQDGGDPKQPATERDRWFALAAPFNGEARALFSLAQRAQGLRWLADPKLVMATEYDRDRRWTRTLLFSVEPPDALPLPLGVVPRVLEDRSVNDRYGDLGSFVTVLGGPYQRRVVRQDGDFVYRSGQGASPQGARPFLDRYELASAPALQEGKPESASSPDHRKPESASSPDHDPLQKAKSERLWQCASGSYESLVAIVWSAADAKPAIVTSFETPTDAPNYYWRDLQTDERSALTKFPDPQPALRGVKQELVKYKRADGVELSATMYTPKDWDKTTRLPLLVWAYPLEFTDNATAGQVSSSPSRFVRVRGPSQLLFVTHGYAVMDNAAMPVVGDPEKVNDTFLDQILMDAQAAIDQAVAMGVADREHVGVGGHSYGAFMTANLLAHSDIFKAGIARSGAYNRTLTPFGFQSERRTLWEAPDAYVKLSPFLSANKVNEPLLFIHGEKDANPGTFPIQSERMYQAVTGNGGTARLVLLPGESHGYQARESVLHTTAEMFDWFDRYVKAPATTLSAKPVSASSAR